MYLDSLQTYDSINFKTKLLIFEEKYENRKMEQKACLSARSFRKLYNQNLYKHFIKLKSPLSLSKKERFYFHNFIYLTLKYFHVKVIFCKLFSSEICRYISLLDRIIQLFRPKVQQGIILVQPRFNFANLPQTQDFTKPRAINMKMIFCLITCVHNTF